MRIHVKDSATCREGVLYRTVGEGDFDTAL